MKVHTANKVDDVTLNVALAKAVRGENAQIHVFEGRNGMRVRVLTKTGAWRMVNWKAGWFSDFLKRATKCEIVEEDGQFRAKLRGAEAAVADDAKLAVAMAAVNMAKPRGFRLALE